MTRHRMIRHRSQRAWFRFVLTSLVVNVALLAKPLLAQQVEGDWLQLRIRSVVQLESKASHVGDAGGRGYWEVLGEIVVAWDRLLFRQTVAHAQTDELNAQREPTGADDVDDDVASDDATSSAASDDARDEHDDPESRTRRPIATSTAERSNPGAASTGADAAAADAWVVSAAFAQRAVEVALVEFAAASQPARLDSMAARAKSSALLPELRVRVRRSTDETLRLTPTASEPDRYTLAGGADLWLEGRVTWKLDRLIFAKEEVTLWRLRQDVEKARAKRVELVVQQLYEWQKAALLAVDPLALTEQRLLAQLERVRAAAVLDALTSGWFSAELERRRAPVAAPAAASPQP